MKTLFTKYSLTSRLLIVICVALIALPLSPAAQSAVPSQTSLFSDNFDDGNASGWTQAAGTWSVVQDSGSYVYYMSAAGTEGRTMTGSQSWTDYSVEARVKVTNFGGSNRAFVAGRVLDFNNYYAASLYNASGGTQLEIRKKVSGSSSTLVSKAYTVATGTWYTVKLEMTGSTLKMYVNNVLELTATDTSRTSGAIGLIPYKAATMYDNVIVTTGSGGGPTATPTRTNTPGGATATPTRTNTPGGPTPTRTSTRTNTPIGPTPTRTRTPTPGGGGNFPPWPTPAGSDQLVTASIVVTGVFDGGMKRYIGSGPLGSGGQNEDQDPIFDLAAGATLKNVILGFPAADGIHCAGACTLQNVWWEDVGEDAATFRGSSSSIQSLVDGGGARHASDKIFQHNGAGTVTIRNFQAEDFGKLYRSCGNCSTQYQRNAVINNVRLTAGGTVAGVNTNYGDTARFTLVYIVNDPSMAICDRFTGNNTGAEPTKTGSGADGVHCIYSPSDIIYQ